MKKNLFYYLQYYKNLNPNLLPMKFAQGLFLGTLLGIVFGTFISSGLDEQDIEITRKTQECIKNGGTEYLHWNGTCQKVLQERKVETILIK